MGGEIFVEGSCFGMLVLLFGRFSVRMFWMAWQAEKYSVLVVDRFH